MDPIPSDPTHGTPGDYSNALYPVYFEVGEWQDVARETISDFLLARSREHPDFNFQPADLRSRDHGYEVELPMQLIPEVVRALAERNVAIYQVLRLQRD